MGKYINTIFWVHIHCLCVYIYTHIDIRQALLYRRPLQKMTHRHNAKTNAMHCMVPRPNWQQSSGNATEKGVERMEEPEYQEVCHETFSLRNSCINETWMVAQKQSGWLPQAAGIPHSHPRDMQKIDRPQEVAKQARASFWWGISRMYGHLWFSPASRSITVHTHDLWKANS